jgi:glycosyltransferase involved in cell wall biosynthesis
VSSNNRILMLLENLPYPQDVRVRREAMALATAGYRVSVICPRGLGQSKRETIHGVKVYRYSAPASANGLVGYVWEYAYSMVASFALSLLLFFREGFDVIHAHNPPDTFVFIAAFYKVFGKRFIFDHHDLSPEMYRARFAGGGNQFVYRALVLLEKITCRFADHIIATNESYKRVEMERGRVSESRITIVRNGIERDRLRGFEPDAALRRKAKTIIGFVGVMGFQDGVDYLLRALHHLIRDFGRTDFYCVIIGTGDAWPGLQVLARKLGLGEYVWFTGFVPQQDMLRYLCTADICVDPDPSNQFNDRSTMVKMMQYMSLGKPIVAFDLPEHRFTAQDAAIYVKPNDERAFARALIQLMDDSHRREALGARGFRRFQTELAWEYSVPKLLEVYTVVLSGPDAGKEDIRTAAESQRRPPLPSHSPAASCESSDPA